MTPKQKFTYACWRFDIWMAGYGTYLEIDAAVSEGRLIPFVRPDEQPIDFQI